jgi:hypothetical protein
MDDADMTETTAVMEQYDAAFLERAPQTLVDLVIPDCGMEGTGPAPDGNRWTGDKCLAGLQVSAPDRPSRSRWSTSTSTATGPIVEALGYGKRA